LEGWSRIQDWNGNEYIIPTLGFCMEMLLVVLPGIGGLMTLRGAGELTIHPATGFLIGHVCSGWKRRIIFGLNMELNFEGNVGGFGNDPFVTSWII
jgi:hypothetical protein